MIKGYRIRLLPTKEQEQKLKNTVNASRFIYNWGLNEQDKEYKKNNSYISCYTLIKSITNLKKQKEYLWLKEVSNTSLQHSIQDLDQAFKNFFNKKTGYPKFKTKKRSKKSFYARPDRLNFNKKTVNIEKVGRIKYKSDYNIDFKNYKILNSRINFDNKYWYLSLNIDICENQTNIKHNDLILGIDLGIKEFAICSNNKIYHNINKTYKIKKIEKRIKHLQRKVNKKYIKNKNYNKTNNILKLEKKISLLYRKLTNIRLNYLYYVINDILKLNPKKIIIEDLNISGLMKNKHLAKSIKDQCWYKFIEILTYKCNWLNIELVKADRFYPSSKTCSQCGYIKKDLKLKDRTYICPECGLIMDRDLNAAINLANYNKIG